MRINTEIVGGARGIEGALLVVTLRAGLQADLLWGLSRCKMTGETNAWSWKACIWVGVDCLFGPAVRHHQDLAW
jgi:hypothetical protein